MEWNREHISLIKKLFNEGKEIEEIAEILNSKIEEMEGTIGKKFRSPKAVAFKLARLGIINSEELEEWDTDKDERTKKQRDSGWRKAKNNILKRDSKKCVICGETKKLQFAHIVPFRKTKVNLEIEAITLCPKDHELFDTNNAFEVNKVWEWMKTKYPEYEKKYKIQEKFDINTNMDKKWIERK